MVDTRTHFSRASPTLLLLAATLFLAEQALAGSSARLLLASTGCSWPGHCVGAACKTENDCSDTLICVSGKCGSTTSTPTPTSKPTSQPTPGPTPQPTPGSGSCQPSKVLNLSPFFLQLPLASGSGIQTVQQPLLASFTSVNFRTSAACDAAVFVTPANGAHTSRSNYPRTELRQTATWDLGGSTTHTMTLNGAVMRFTPDRPQIVVGQLFSEQSGEPVIELRVHGDGTIQVWQWDASGNRVMSPPTVVGSGYRLGNRYTFRITARAGRVSVFYNDMVSPVLSTSISVPGCYFKAGNYLQDNSSGAQTSEVWIYSLAVN